MQLVREKALLVLLLSGMFVFLVSGAALRCTSAV